MDFSSKELGISSVLSLILFGVLTAYPFKLYRILKDGKLKDNGYKKKYGKIFEIYKNQKSAAFECVPFFRKWVYSVVLVVFPNTYIQLTFIMVANIIVLYLLNKMRPYVNRKINRLKIISELLFSVSYFLLIVYFFSKDRYSVTVYKTVGWITTYMMIVFMIIEIITLFITKKTQNDRFKKAVKRIKMLRAFKKAGL